MVRTNAWRFSVSTRDRYERHISAARSFRRPRSPRNLATESPQRRPKAGNSAGSTYSAAGSVARRSSQLTFAAEAAGVDEDEAVAKFRKLVGELHGDAAPEGMADHGHPPHIEDVQEVAEAARLVAEW